MTTQFTMNSHCVAENRETLQRLGAMTVQTHQSTPMQLDTCGSGCCNSVGLPEGTTFVVNGHHTRSSLVRLLGSRAMVRGVKHL